MLIAQISDPHLRPSGRLYQEAVDSNRMFEAAIAQLLALRPRPDLVILSGDVTDEGTPAEYAVARELLARIPMPLLVLPGNHDDREGFRAAFADHAYLPSSGPLHFAVGDRGPVRIVGFDVTLPGLHHGLIDEDAAAWLDTTLSAEPERPTLVMMHQPPVLCRVPYIDAYVCHEGHRMAGIVARHPAVERIACGHIHRFMTVRFGGTTLCTAPSTTTALALQIFAEAETRSYIEPPAFLLHHWTPDMGLITHWVPIGTFEGPYLFG